MLRVFIAFLTVTVLLTSCKNKPYDPVESLPSASGEIGEIVLVMEKEYWTSSLMLEINDKFAKEVMSLPQPEPLMTVKRVTDKGFSGNIMNHHSVLMVEIGSLSEGSQAFFGQPQTNVWSNGQLVYKLKAPDLESATELMKVQGDKLFEYYQDHYQNKIKAEIAANKSASINEEMGITMNVNMDVPNSFTLVSNYNDLIWLKQQREKYVDGQDHEIQIGILAYTYPYTDSLAFTMEHIIAKRDSMTKKYVPGMIEGSYMVTEQQYGLENFETNANGYYVSETRGVWKMHKAIMGGPFVSLTVYDPEKNRIVCVEGYVFAPHFRKMPYIRELEAILYSFSFTDG